MFNSRYFEFIAVSMVTGIVLLVCLCFGSSFINPLEIFSLNLYPTFIGKPASSPEWIIRLRFIRLMTAFVVGGGLAVAGLAYQAVLRNPLAEPFILGVSGGAGLGAAIAIASGLAAWSCLAVPTFSFTGALIVLSLVLFMARGAGMAYTNNVMLSGVVAGTVCSSALMFIISIMGFETLHSITWWMLGNLQPGDTTLLKAIGGVVIVATLIMFIFGREANALSLGEEMAYYLGISPAKLVLLLLGLASFITAAVVSLSGIIGFVGLIVPHILRRVFGADHRRLFPLALLFGGMFLMICDTIARSILEVQEIPAGVVTAFIGGPFFLWLLNRHRER